MQTDSISDLIEELFSYFESRKKKQDWASCQNFIVKIKLISLSYGQ